MSDQPLPTSRLPLEQLRVGAFRGIRNLELAGLSRINLFVGGGNSGKTSVLEAVSVFTAPQSVAHWLSVARSRETRSGNIFFFDSTPSYEYLRWLFPHAAKADDEVESHGEILIEGDGRSNIRALTASCEPTRGLRPAPPNFIVAAGDPDEEEEASEEEDRLIEDEGWKFILQCRTDELFPLPQVAHTFWARSEDDPLPRQGPRLPSDLLPPYAHRSQPLQVRGLTKAVVGDEKDVIEDLMNDLDANITGIEIISDKRGTRPLVALRHKHVGLAPITAFGDGIRRALMIALTVQQNRGGVVLVDEIEAALHVSALGKVFPWLERACVEHDVQLFGTTHSLETIDVISTCTDLDTLAAYHLDGAGSEEVKRYSRGMLKRLVHDRGLDIR